MKTKFWILIEKNFWLIANISKDTWIHRDTITKATNYENNVKINNRLKILKYLIDNSIIEKETILNDLFSKEKETCEEQEKIQ